ncbi:unnamed protein product [Chrysoparadoxa australica]
MLLGCSALDLVLKKNKAYKKMSSRQKRNVHTYFLEIVITTPFFFWLTIAAPHLLLVRDATDERTKHGALAMAYCITWVCFLYLFELVYRTSTNVWLFLHHVATMGMTYAAIVAFLETRNNNLTLLLVMIYSALTEQATFVALLMHRFHVNGAGVAFKVASIMSYLSKGAVFIITWVLYGSHVWPGIADESDVHAKMWNFLFRILVPVVNIVLLVTQVHGNRVLWKLGDRIMKAVAQESKLPEVAADVEAPAQAPTQPPQPAAAAFGGEMLECQRCGYSTVSPTDGSRTGDSSSSGSECEVPGLSRKGTLTRKDLERLERMLSS